MVVLARNVSLKDNISLMFSCQLIFLFIINIRDEDFLLWRKRQEVMKFYMRKWFTMDTDYPPIIIHLYICQNKKLISVIWQGNNNIIGYSNHWLGYVLYDDVKASILFCTCNNKSRVSSMPSSTHRLLLGTVIRNLDWDCLSKLRKWECF